MNTPFNLIQSLRSWFFPRDADISLQSGKKIVVTGANVVITSGGITITGGNITIDGTVDGVDISAHAANADAHHPQSHTIASHSDTTATGAELETLTDGSNADSLHSHSSSVPDPLQLEDHLIVKEISPPSAAASGYGRIWFATDGKLHTTNDGGTNGTFYLTSDFSNSPGASSLPLITNSNGYLVIRGMGIGTGTPAANNIDVSGNITVSGTVDGVDIAAHAANANAHHAQSHTVASHSDTTATGAELETLTNGSDASSLHIHDGRYFREGEFSSAPTASEPIQAGGSGGIRLTQLGVGKAASGSNNIDAAADITADADVYAGGGVAVGTTSVNPLGNCILLVDRGSDPSTPPSGHGYIYSKNDRLYHKNDAGTVYGPLT